MKKIFYIAICLLILGQPTRAAVTDAFESGNQFYRDGNFTKAIENYLSVEEQGYESFELYFNLGNAYYKNENIPSAVLYYEKALKLKPGDEDARFNLRLASLQTVDKIEPVEKLFLNSMWEKALNMKSADGWATWCIILLFVGFTLLAIYLFVPALFVRKFSFYTGIVVIALGLFSLVMSNAQHQRMSTHSEGIIFAPNVTVKSAPGEEGNKLFVIHEGTKVSLLQESGEWVEISLPNGNAGWVKANDLKNI